MNVSKIGGTIVLTFVLIITCAEEVMLYPALVCLFVCLSVC